MTLRSPFDTSKKCGPIGLCHSPAKGRWPSEDVGCAVPSKRKGPTGRLDCQKRQRHLASALHDVGRQKAPSLGEIARSIFCNAAAVSAKFNWTGAAQQAFLSRNDALVTPCSRRPDQLELIDTPSMGELRLTDSEEGITAIFDGLDDFAGPCRRNDCSH